MIKHLINSHILSYISYQCHGVTALREFFGRLSDRQTQYLAVVGAGCSPATEPIAEIVNYYNIPMVSSELCLCMLIVCVCVCVCVCVHMCVVYTCVVYLVYKCMTM